jgi:hypothetical protein
MHCLIWDEQQGMGVHTMPLDVGIYDASYWHKYVGYADTDLGRKLTAARLAFVRRFVRDDEDLTDVGIGSGDFIEARGGGNTFGWDVNPIAIEWLRERYIGRDPRVRGAAHLSLWDTLEHIDDPAGLVDCARGCVFVSTPIYRDREHALGSRHLRPGEHRWYWTESGLVRWFARMGFRLLEPSSWFETELGRDSIGTFAFGRGAR